MSNMSETAQLFWGSILGAGAFVICRKAGIDPFNKETALKAWGCVTVFAVAVVVLSNITSSALI